jgi:DNA-binding NtrC family response regulator
LLNPALADNLVVTSGADVALMFGSVAPDIGDSDARLICASNRDLRKRMETGKFREDLYYRIDGIPVQLPTLRARREDILPLAESFLRRTCAEMGSGAKRLAVESMQILECYPWPGNIRELENAVGRAVALSEGEEITPPDLCLALADIAPEGATPEEIRFHESVREHKRAIIRRAIRNAAGNKTKAAEALGLTPTYLSRLIRVLEVENKEP